MRARAGIALLAGSLACIVPARAEEPDYAGMLLENQSLLQSPPDNCDHQTADLNSFQLQQCSAIAFRDADRAMNAAYRRALEAGDTDRNDRLRQAQRDWLAFRNLHCDWESLTAKGGSLEPVIMGQCLVTVTQDRTRQLSEDP